MDLNTSLIILGVIALIALVAHGLWANRREKSTYFNQPNPFSQGAKATPVEPAHSMAEQQIHSSLSSQLKAETNYGSANNEYMASANAEQMNVNPIQPEPEKNLEDIQIRIPGAEMSSSEMNYDGNNQFNYSESQSFGSFEPVQSTAQEQYNFVEPSFGENKALEPQNEVKQSAETAPTQFMTFYVVAAENRQFQGAQLHKELEELNFIFGTDHLFHRHLDCTASSPVLFSVADINPPGTFNLYTLHSYYTVGIALFMQIPSAGNNRANLNLMLTSAKRLAEQLDGFVLDEQQRILTPQLEAEYLNLV